MNTGKASEAHKFFFFKDFSDEVPSKFLRLPIKCEVVSRNSSLRNVRTWITFVRLL